LLFLQQQPAQAQDHLRQRNLIRVADNRAKVQPRNAGPRGPLTKHEADYIDSVLTWWEHSNSKIKNYRCKFQLLEYDATFGKRNKATTISQGVVKYAAPDKGLFKVDKIFHYRAPSRAGEKEAYKQFSGEVGEHWVCDGKSIFKFEARDKQLIQRKLPPELQGKAITEGPLPFLFGAKAETIKQRYWFYVTTPKGSTGEYWLMAYPKRREDAANFKMVEIIINEKDFLPKAIQVFATNYHPKKSPARKVYTFDNREINPFYNNLNKLNLFHREFYQPAVPRGWKKVVAADQASGNSRQRAPAQNRQPMSQARNPGRNSRYSSPH